MKTPGIRTVTAELKARVNTKVAECIAKVNARYGINMRPINIKYDIDSARLGGMAVHSERAIRLNPAFLVLHTEHYLQTTVPHEVAHIATRDVHPWPKMVSAHGYEWKKMMDVVGAPANRCHNYTVPEGVKLGKPKTKHHYKCSKCNADVFTGPKIHAKILKGSTYWHATCGRSGKLVFADTVGRVSYTEARRMVHLPVPPKVHTMLGIQPQGQTSKPVPVKKSPECDHAGMNKFDRCLAIYMSLPGKSRKHIISKFVNEVDMTPAGASTYYTNCAKAAK